MKRTQGHAGLIKSIDNGKPVDIQVPAGFSPQSGQLAMKDAGSAYFLWPVYTEQERSISFASVNEGSSQTANTIDLLQGPYVPDTAPPSDLQMAISGDRVHVMWINSTGPQSEYEQQIFVRTSTDAGKSFGDSVSLASMVTVPEFGSVATLLTAAGIVGTIILVGRLPDWCKS